MNAKRTSGGSVTGRLPDRAAHFVRFRNLHDSHFWAACRAFGRPDFLHRYWDQRAFREIADGDLVVFAKGEADQPVVPFNGDDEFYAMRAARSGVAL